MCRALEKVQLARKQKKVIIQKSFSLNPLVLQPKDFF